ncbi:Pyruvate/Phosphoenolpyruvate kinase-like domain-containing protein [Entophlyctis helioformis]|nr:Pyruvate/Phosphoenolpyruvate kinase-like domain-containing protein [Entophlyctis helioformis]
MTGSDERKLASSLKARPDSFIYDLEDSVALHRKGAAREMVFNSEKAVRINSIGSGLELDDLNVILRSRRLQALLIPKVNSAKDIAFVSHMIDSVAPVSNRANIRIMASIESAMGIMNLREIATADPRIDALVFAAEDYCADTGLLRTPSRQEMLYARQAVVTAACAYNLQAIDLVCVDFQSPEILESECKEGREFGFTGKQAIHPKQIQTIHSTFAPSPKDVDRATRILDGYSEHVRKGLGAFSLDGKMIDMPVVKWAQRLLAKARDIAEIDNAAR